ncbi:hypothetical protein C1645_528164 [Glomus cerebriforme]|uniref:Uncharacterized protein n=1 Tax=Glomus cerebriforme TaxID=658196 RepID=A0A397S6P5_9GLOM|nr:hypothetical protein C1645_528164 [Glomus cerebriforme]
MMSTNDNNSSLGPIDVDNSSNPHLDQQLSENNSHNSCSNNTQILENNSNYSSMNQQQNNVPISNEFNKNELENEILRLKTELEKSKENFKLREEEYEKYEKENEQKIIELKNKTIEQETTIKDLQYYTKKIETSHTKLRQRLKDKKTEIQSLKQKNSELEDEASNYQSALGVATNFEMSDDDINHNVQLNDDILSLQDKIDDYVTNLVRSKVDVKFEEIAKLLPRYECQYKIDFNNPDKQFVKAILQRHVLETIFEFANYYFSQNKEDHYLESDVAKKTDELYELMEKFSWTRDGTDEITKVTPIKLRQVVYVALGMRGLGDMIKSDNKYLHKSVEKFSEDLNNSMNQYRVLIDPKKKEDIDALAKILIQEVFRIFYFRLKIQEPVPQYYWFNCGDKVNKMCMEASWDEEEIDDLVVELCTFPLIYQDINSNQKIFTLAKVFTRHVPKSSILQNVGTTIGRAFRSITGYDNSDQVERSNDFTVQNTTASDESDESDGSDESGESGEYDQSSTDHSTDHSVDTETEESEEGNVETNTVETTAENN